MRFGHMGDAFEKLRMIDEDGGDLREWAAAVAELMGEQPNLEAFWPADGGQRAGLSLGDLEEELEGI